jgi:hypothetical protein
MATSACREIESQFAQLPTETQLSLLERLVHRVRAGVGARHDSWEAELSAMAADPEVQKELSRIHNEFGSAEADGLERA